MDGSFMSAFKTLLFILLVAPRFPAESSPVVTMNNVKDLREEWQIFQGGYRKYEGQRVKAIYFSLEGSTHTGDFLSIQSPRTFSVFINQKLIAHKNRGAIRLRIDSLSALYSTTLSIGVF